MPTPATVAEIQKLGSEIKTFKLVAPGAFKNATPGAHIDIFLPNGLTRQYSLCDFDPIGNWGVIGVKNEVSGRGGSAWLHANLEEGASVDIGDVRNNFDLDENAPGYLLIAGGIGVTPMVSMARRLTALGKSFRFVYLCRTKEAAGFLDILKEIVPSEALTVHFDDADGVYDLKGELGRLPAGQQVYFCGPEGMLSAVLDLTRDWPAQLVRFERFSADPAAASQPASGFTVELAQSGGSFEIPDDKSILDVLPDAGLSPEYGCTAGVCGACTCGVIEGEVDHRDSTQTADEHDAGGTMCICVSRAKGAKLVLDI